MCLVKFFRASTIYDLERDINLWLETRNIRIKEINHSSCSNGNGVIYSVMIAYENKEIY